MLNILRAVSDFLSNSQDDYYSVEVLELYSSKLKVQIKYIEDYNKEIGEFLVLKKDK